MEGSGSGRGDSVSCMTRGDLSRDVMYMWDYTRLEGMSQIKENLVHMCD